MVNKAILLVGGKGTRLAPLTNKTPKPMLKVAGKPVTEHQIIKARDAGIQELVLATSYLAEVFEPYFGDGSRFGISITYAVEETPLGTGGAIANAAKELKLQKDESVAVFNGDVLSGHDLRAQFAQHLEEKADVTLYLTRVADPRAYGCVPIDENKKVTAFLEKMENPIADTINAGCYVFSSQALAAIPQNQVVSVERDTFPNLLSSGRNLFGYLDETYWIDMGTPQSFIKASRDLILNPRLSAATEGVTQMQTSAQASAQASAHLLGRDVSIHPSAIITGGSAIGDGCQIFENVSISGSMIGDGVQVGAGSQIIDSYIAPGQKISPQSIISGALIGE